MFQKTPYDLPADELVNRLISAAAESGPLNSGIAIDPMASSHVIDLHYLKGCLLARLAGAKTEIQSGTLVSIPTDIKVLGCDLEGCSHETPDLESGNYKVKTVWFFADRWYLELVDPKTEGGGVALYPASQFKVS